MWLHLVLFLPVVLVFLGKWWELRKLNRINCTQNSKCDRNSQDQRQMILRRFFFSFVERISYGSVSFIWSLAHRRVFIRKDVSCGIGRRRIYIYLIRIDAVHCLKNISSDDDLYLTENELLISSISCFVVTINSLDGNVVDLVHIVDFQRTD